MLSERFAPYTVDLSDLLGVLANAKESVRADAVKPSVDVAMASFRRLFYVVAPFSGHAGVVDAVKAYHSAMEYAEFSDDDAAEMPSGDGVRAAMETAAREYLGLL